jgi:protein dithiol oxidoreductase (disulfide-forming)
MLKRIVVGLAVILAAAIAQAQPKAGVEYRELGAAQPAESPGKIEVIEFFSYLCPHCYEFEPVLAPWVAKLPKDTQFRRVPAIFSADYMQAARAYYALEAIGELKRLHTALFDAVHTGARLRVANEAALTEWLGKHGVDTKKFAAAYRSFSVEANLKRAVQINEDYKIDGVPAMAVNGKYVVLTNKIKSLDQILSISDYLIERARKEGGNAAPKKK